MKEIRAFIKPHKLDQVVMALHRIDGLTGISVSQIQGFGRGRGNTSPESQKEELYGFIDHAKLEIFCSNDLAEQVVNAIEKNAHTGLRGDGKIYILPVDDAVRISTGEHGVSAI